jgi:NAD-reducing hydrogenase large subunit
MDKSNEKQIVITPITRIEGHAKVVIHLNSDDSVKEAKFHVVDFRGFEKFTEDRPFYEMPAITCRSCGICPVSHLLASASACDAIVGVRPTKTTMNLRHLIHMGQMIQSHALNFYHLSAPDLLFGFDSDPKTRNIFGIIEKYPDIAVQGVKLRKFGQEIIARVAGKRIHSGEWVTPGGAKWPLKKEDADYLSNQLPQVLDMTQKTLDIHKKWLGNFKDEVENFGNFPSYYMGMVKKDGSLELYDGNLCIKDDTGKIIVDQMNPDDYEKYIGEAVEPYSFMKFPYFKPLGYPKGMYRVGPLARLNVASHCGTPLADAEFKEFKKLGSNGIVQSTFHYHYARLIEALYCVERTKILLEDPDTLGENVYSNAKAINPQGIGACEAPRGTLFHHYKVNKDGLITWNNMIIATEHNNLAYNEAITQVAKKYVKAKQLQEGMLNRVEAVIRAFDPCLSCATHAVGQMPLEVQLVSADGKLVDSKTR